ncbi:papain family cysteine protease [Oesophagostomum dentatum]|uniref:Papain family cysteine protease n=2 Tax=Oesophagostomum dentatum TaxID=61180 RepID=A0A0B1TV90_OESDE|nr:papain family cysteine protease [Oesophagostomum dentatum]
MDIKYLEEDANAQRAQEIQLNAEIPERFDAREKWPQSESMKLIRDQATCASSWAVSAASAMSDRLYVQSNGSLQTILSDSDILSCCGDYCGYGCEGGFGIRAWEYVVKNGVCSGGPYRKKGVCKPYVFYPCGKHEGQPYYGECPETYEETPTCRKKCQFLYKKGYEQDKVYATNAYYVEPTVEAIQKEILVNGPVQAGFIVYDDFLNYKGGVYVHTAGQKKGALAAKIIGWGVEGTTPYWLMANSFNTDFGEKGYFRILRGKNECLVEEMVVAGVMKV